MKLDGPYILKISGDTTALGTAHNRDAIGYLFQRLLTGDEAVMENLAVMGISVELIDEFILIPRPTE